ncbi:MAG: PEP-utilizing enzyme [Flavobacteriales bacterium]|nr:PEP-utilizing enzyme [Flavobacteriales bacterium]
MKSLLHINNITSEDLGIIGGKAQNLYHLSKAGFNVPKWSVISAPYLNQTLSLSGKPLTFESITEFDFSSDLINEIIGFFGGEKYFAVRSSAIGEDGQNQSYAGQFETVLYVKPAEIASAIKTVWQSIFSDHVQTYRAQNKIQNEVQIAVIIQEMIPAEVSGVGFGMNPTSGNRKEKVISSLYGLGEGLVSGELNADVFVVGNDIQSEIADKTHKLDYDGNSVTKVAVSSELQKRPSLTSLQVESLANLLNDLHTYYRSYQDIEFAYYNGQLYLLQSRPITTVDKIPDVSNNKQIWDNSNIIESYPGQTKPLTFSFILKMYSSVYQDFCKLLGVPEQTINKHKDIFDNMLSLINTKVYYNLMNWYKVLSMLPGYTLNKAFMEKMMGVKESIEDDVALPTGKKWKSWLLLIKSIFRMIKEIRSLKKNRIKFLKMTKKVFATYESLNMAQLSASELLDKYNSYEKLLLDEWQPPLVNDFFAMIYFGILNKMCDQMDTGAEGLHNKLLVGSSDIISIEPAKRINAIVKQIASNSSHKTEVLAASQEELESVLKTDVQSFKMIEEYINAFGDRATGELKLESHTYKTHPSLFYRLVQTHLKNDKINEEVNIDNIRIEAEQLALSKLKGKFIKKWIFKKVLKKTRDLVSNRENLRFERTRAFGIVRKIYRNVGLNFYRENIIDAIDDIFYLKQEEIASYVNGTSCDYDLRSFIALRKKSYESFEQEKTSDRIETYGIVYNGNNFNQKKSDANADLKGIGCSPGVVEGEVQVLMDPTKMTSLDNRILVTESTDPGWVALFPTCSAIIVERGSLLSHSAIVSREMGIPCIVAVDGLLERLKTGDKIKMDGATGNIELLKDEV